MRHTLQLLREINFVSAKYYLKDSSSINSANQKYLINCNELLDDYFKNSLQESYLFSALSYVSHKLLSTEIGIVKGSDPKTDYNFHFHAKFLGQDTFKETLTDAIFKVMDDRLVSMTKILLDKTNSRDLFLFSKPNSYKYIIDETNEKACIIGFDLSQLTYFDDITLFAANEKNRGQINILFDKLKDYSDFVNYTTDCIVQYIWHYKKLSVGYFKSNKLPFFIHFIRPSIIDDKYGYNLLLSVATNRELTEDELATIDLTIYRIVSLMVLEKIQETEKLKALSNVSNSIHIVKTLLQITLRPQASFIRDKIARQETLDLGYLNNYIKEIDDLIMLGELINISSKVSKGMSLSGTLNDLAKTGLISTEKSQDIREVDLTRQLNELIKLFNESPENNKKYCKLNLVKDHIVLDQSFISFASFYLTPQFFRVFCATVIENYIEHGVHKRDFSNDLTIQFERDCLKITSQKSKSNEPIHKPYTGVYGAINIIFGSELKSFEIEHNNTIDFKHELILKKTRQ